MRLALGHAFSLKQLFDNMKLNRLKIKTKDIPKWYSDGSKRDFCAIIFARSVELVVNDIIENNVHFKLPTIGRGSSYMYMDRIEGETFKKAFKMGKWRDVDFIKSFFTGYQMCLVLNASSSAQRKKRIYLSTAQRNRITERTNEGVSY